MRLGSPRSQQPWYTATPRERVRGIRTQLVGQGSVQCSFPFMPEPCQVILSPKCHGHCVGLARIQAFLYPSCPLPYRSLLSQHSYSLHAETFAIYTTAAVVDSLGPMVLPLAHTSDKKNDRSVHSSSLGPIPIVSILQPITNMPGSSRCMYNTCKNLSVHS